MSIEFLEAKKQFHLQTRNTSYLMQVVGDGHLVHAYWGKKIHTPDFAPWVDLFPASGFSPKPQAGDESISFDTMPREYPDYGRSDYSSPAYMTVNPDGSHINVPVYQGFEIINGKPALAGLPSTHSVDDDVKTLVINLFDELTGLMIDLYYTVFDKYDAMTRHVVFRNTGTETVVLEKALSCNVDFYQDNEFELLHLYGGWARERHLSRIPIGHSSHVIDSKRGSSSHAQNPFIALVKPETTECHGDVYGMNLVYSGSFIGEVDVNALGSTRMQMGINPIDFQWHLEAGHTFTTPETVMVYSDHGLDGMSAIYHKLYRDCLCRSLWSKKVRPILINNWEATYFDFDEAKLKGIMKDSAELGLELFVLDDGWFGKRNSDKSSLGDWQINEEKLPSGLQGLSDYAAELNMKFGLWFEPEMVSPESHLYRAHPDWCLHVDQRYRSESRNQLILDMGRADVRDCLFEQIDRVLSQANIEYVKWDMNRNMTEVGSALLPPERQKETSHRYILGLYELLERLTTAYPHILFESCSGGGGRFDPGMHYYMPQAWTSDDTDSFERLKIQWGTSMVYPPVMMGAHVSAVPNHQVSRSTPFHTRGNVAMAGNLGYELDVTKLTDEEKQKVLQQVQTYKRIRKTVQFGDFHRLTSPYQGDSTSWMFISNDAQQVLVFYYRHLAKPDFNEAKLKLRCLEEDALYRLEDGRVLHGDTLMNFGVRLPLMKGDFDSCMLILSKV